MIERVASLMREKKITQRALCDAIGVSTSTANNWFKKGKEPDVTLIIPISEFLEVTPEYLLTGKESPPASDPEDPMLSQIISLYKKLSDVQRGELIGYARRMAEEQEIIEGNLIPSNGTGGTKKDTTPPVAAESVAG